MKNNGLLTQLYEGRCDKEVMLHQHAHVFWMCGLSGAGKSTLARQLDRALLEKGYLSQILDGDVVRNGLNKGLGFSTADRQENLRRVAEVARLFTECGIIAIISFISPTFKARQMAREIIGPENFSEIYINAPFEECERRDTKGLYQQARKGMIKDFTGIDSPFEPPLHPDLEIKTDQLTISESTAKLLDFTLPLISNNN